MQYSDKQIKELLNGIYSGGITEYNIPEDLYYAIANYLKEALYKGFGGSLEDFTGKDWDLLNELRENVYMFSAAKSFQELKAIRGLMYDDEGNLRANADFNVYAGQLFENWDENYGLTEYNTAIANATMAGKWNEIQNNKDILPLLQYQTVGDACDICEPLDGITAPVDDDIWDTIMPTNHFNCECIVTQEEADVEVTENNQEVVDQVSEKMDNTFKMNPGKDRVIFSDSHPYFQVDKKDKKFAKENFGLPIPEKTKPETVTKEAYDKAAEFSRYASDKFDKEYSKKTINAYTVGGYHVNSGFLNDNVSHAIEDKIYSQNLSLALSKLPNFKGKVFRVVNDEDGNIFKTFKNNIGKKITWKGFTSSTSSEEYADQLCSYKSDKPIKLVIEGKTGKDISHLSDYKEEYEVLFDKNTQFKILKIDDGNIIHLQEL